MLLTAAVDTQDNRLEYEICGWGVGEECWGIKKGVILGIPDNSQTWQNLDQQLDKLYKLPNGRSLAIAQTFIDSGGHYTKEVYKYCRQNIHKRRFAIKGASGAGVPLIYKFSSAKEYGIPLVLLGTDSGKQYVMDRLSIENVGPKYFHYPIDEVINEELRGYDQIYFKGLLAEKLVPKKVKGKIIMVWQNIASDKRNEPLDLRVYNLACLHSINPDWNLYKKLLQEKQPDKAINKVQKNNDNKNKKQKYGCIKKSSSF